MPVGIFGERQRSKSAPGCTSRDAIVQSVCEADPVRDGRAVTERRPPTCARSFRAPSPVGIGDQERREVRIVPAVLPAPALPVLGERGRDRFERGVGCAPALEAEPHEVHTRRPLGWARRIIASR